VRLLFDADERVSLVDGGEGKARRLGIAAALAWLLSALEQAVHAFAASVSASASASSSFAL